MGMTQRNGGSGTVPVNVRPNVKTCPEESGIAELALDEGTKIICLAHTFFPSHDRSAVAAILNMLRHQRDREAAKPAAERKKIVVMLLGGVIHEEAFKQVIDEQDEATKLLKIKPVAEVTRIRKDNETFEDRFLGLARLGGDFVRDFAEASGGHVLYIPSVTGMLPNEVDFMRFVLEKKKQLDRKADKHPKEAVKGSDIPAELDEFLGVHNDPRINVLPFGSAVDVNDHVRFLVGDFRLRTPGSASQKEATENPTNMSVVRSFDGTAASAWFTSPKHTLGGAQRIWWQTHEVPCLFDIRAQLGYLRRYQLRGTGFWAGKIVGGKVKGQVVELAQGDDKRRSFFVYGNVYSEDAPSQRANRFKLELKTPAVEVAPKGEAATEKPVSAKPEKKTRKTKPSAKAAETTTRRPRGSGKQK